MKYIALSLIVMVFLLHSPEQAQAQFSKEDVITLLRGNSIIGDDKGIRFVQYFSPNGQTVYERASGTVEIGRWNVNENGDVCTQWQANEIACYKVQKGIAGIEWLGPLETNPNEISTRTLLRPQNLTSVPMPTLTRRTQTTMMGDVVAGFLEMY